MCHVSQETSRNMGSDIQRERKENYWRTYGGWYRIGVEVGNYYLRLYYYYFRLFFHLGHTYPCEVLKYHNQGMSLGVLGGCALKARDFVYTLSETTFKHVPEDKVNEGEYQSGSRVPLG